MQLSDNSSDLVSLVDPTDDVNLANYNEYGHARTYSIIERDDAIKSVRSEISRLVKSVGHRHPMRCDVIRKVMGRKYQSTEDIARELNMTREGVSNIIYLVVNWRKPKKQLYPLLSACSNFFVWYGWATKSILEESVGFKIDVDLIDLANVLNLKYNEEFKIIYARKLPRELGRSQNVKGGIKRTFPRKIGTIRELTKNEARMILFKRATIIDEPDGSWFMPRGYVIKLALQTLKVLEACPGQRISNAVLSARLEQTYFYNKKLKTKRFMSQNPDYLREVLKLAQSEYPLRWISKSDTWEATRTILPGEYLHPGELRLVKELQVRGPCRVSDLTNCGSWKTVRGEILFYSFIDIVDPGLIRLLGDSRPFCAPVLPLMERLFVRKKGNIVTKWIRVGSDYRCGQYYLEDLRCWIQVYHGFINVGHFLKNDIISSYNFTVNHRFKTIQWINLTEAEKLRIKTYLQQRIFEFEDTSEVSDYLTKRMQNKSQAIQMARAG